VLINLITLFVFIAADHSAILARVRYRAMDTFGDRAPRILSIHSPISWIA